MALFSQGHLQLRWREGSSLRPSLLASSGGRITTLHAKARAVEAKIGNAALAAESPSHEWGLGIRREPSPPGCTHLELRRNNGGWRQDLKY